MNDPKNWDQLYNMTQYAYGKQANDFLQENLALLPRGEVLSLAEGEGRNAVFLAQQGFDVTAVDASKVGSEKGRRLALEMGVDVNFITADVTRFEMGEQQWDAVISIFFPLPPDEREHLYRKITDALKPGGILLIEAYRPEQIHNDTGGGNQPEFMQNAATLKKEIPYLQFEQLIERQRNIIEGVYHTGLGEVVQAIVRKPS